MHGAGVAADQQIEMSDDGGKLSRRRFENDRHRRIERFSEGIRHVLFFGAEKYDDTGTASLNTFKDLGEIFQRPTLAVEFAATGEDTDCSLTFFADDGLDLLKARYFLRCGEFKRAQGVDAL